jgi:hypothetical protein
MTEYTDIFASLDRLEAMLIWSVVLFSLEIVILIGLIVRRR